MDTRLPQIENKLNQQDKVTLQLQRDLKGIQEEVLLNKRGEGKLDKAR